MKLPKFEVRLSTEEEILIFLEKFGNECSLNPEVRFFTMDVQDESYAIFAIKMLEEKLEIKVLFFIILEHSLKDEVNIYNVFCEFAKEMTNIPINRENLGKSVRICWNLQDEKYRMYFDEVICKKGVEHFLNTSELYNNGYLAKFNFECSAWKEKVNLVDLYYFEQKFSSFDVIPMSLEQYTDYNYVVLLHTLNDEISEITPYFTYRNYNSQTKKIIPLSKNVLRTLNIYCESLLSNCMEYMMGDQVWTEKLEKEMKLLKKYSEDNFDKIWEIEDINEPYLANINEKLCIIRSNIICFKLPEKGE